MNNTPPKYLIHFFRWYCHPDFVEDLEGDLVERFEKCVEERGLRRAKRGISKDVIKLFRPGIIKPFNGGYQLSNYDMFNNYFNIAWRNLLKQKLHSGINIAGLSLGISCFILISLYVQHELSYDTFYKNANEIYRIYNKQKGNNVFGGKDSFGLTTVGLAPVLNEEFPEVKAASTLNNQTALISLNGNHFYEKGMRADENFFEVFPLEFVAGNPNQALSNAKTIVLTLSLARKIFGSQDPINQTLLYQNRVPFKVTAVVEDLPSNSSLKYSFLTSMKNSEQYNREMNNDRWNNNDYYTFFTLNNTAYPDNLERKFPELIDRFNVDKYAKEYGFQMSYLIQPLSKLHLETDIGLDIGLKGNKKYLTLFSIIGMLILLLACINYVNLATARSILRAKEVGLRKAIGAQRNQIMAQFIGESALTTLLALFVALLISYLALPTFSVWLERSLEINFLENTLLIPGLIILMLLIGLITGSYPALFVSSLRPVQALKGKTDRKISALSIQRWLIVGQYTATIVLIIGSLVVYQQFKFIQNKDLGFQKVHVIAISVRDFSLGDKVSTIKNELRTNPQIVAVTDAIELPTNVTSSTIVRHLHENKEEGFHINRARVGMEYIDVFGINLIAGRNFSEDIKSDRQNARILNETAVQALGWTPEEAVGKRFIDWEEKEIIGVVKDFHSHSLHREIEPLMLQMKSNYTPFFAVKIRSENIPKSISFLQKTLKEYSPYPFEYQFLDDRYEQLYRAEQKFGVFFGVLTALGIFIATLGLVGMTALMVNQRIREIGIRKVLGASIKNILSTLASGYVKLMFLSFLIAVPTAWWAMSSWLQEFAYRIDLQWWVFAVAGGVTISLAILTIASQSIKTAVANPVDTLRSE